MIAGDILAEKEKLCCMDFYCCGAHVVREKIGRGGWTKRFCFGNPGECVHSADGMAKKKIFQEFKRSPAY